MGAVQVGAVCGRSEEGGGEIERGDLFFLKLFLLLLVWKDCSCLTLNRNYESNLASWLNGWVFVYELSGCGFESCGLLLKLQISCLFRAKSSLTLRQLRVYTDFETRTWRDNNIQCASYDIYSYDQYLQVEFFSLSDKNSSACYAQISSNLL